MPSHMSKVKWPRRARHVGGMDRGVCEIRYQERKPTYKKLSFRVHNQRLLTCGQL